MQTVLLHICCGVCAGSAVEKLRQQGFCVIGFYYNPNIYPQEEYLRRQKAVEEVARILNFELVSGAYDNDNWLAKTKGLENEPEGGGRCDACFQLRLEEAHKFTTQRKLDYFTTTLTVSPHKNAAKINQIGKAINLEKFLVNDFKKQDGWRQTMEFSKKHNLYRQHYCGCVYST